MGPLMLKLLAVVQNSPIFMGDLFNVSHLTHTVEMPHTHTQNGKT